jgi:threonine/homoserine/homoserine lactone efflux protein
MEGHALTAFVMPVAIFVFVMSITPGPNNIMLLSSGARFGLRRSLPHMFGITGGFLALLGVTTAGVGAVVLAHPLVTLVLTIGCCLYLLWLGWLLLRSEPLSADVPTGSPEARPLRWLDAALFQLANPKAWAMAVPLASMASNSNVPTAVRYILLMAVVAVVNLPCILLWTLSGAAIRSLLGFSWVSRGFNILMAGMIALTAVWMLIPLFESE